MKLVADANLFLAVVLNEPERDTIIELTEKYDLIAPLILPFEIGNALSAMAKRNRLRDEQCLSILNQFRKIPVRLVEVDIDSALRIAMDKGIYAYDAYYLEVAKRLRQPLMTLDSRMRDVAQEMGIEVFEIK
jgi:predicted nucleic acid-binding protein